MQRTPSAIVFGRVVEALLEREFKTRFGQYKFGLLWALAEPLVHIAIFAVVFGMRKSEGFGGASPSVFVAAGVLPYILFQSIVKRCQSAVSGNLGLFIFRQVRPLNAMVARLAVEVVLYVIVAMLVIFAMAMMELNAIPNDIGATTFGVFLLVIFGFAMGTIFCVSESIYPESAKLISVVMKPMFFISAVIYPMSLIPQQYHHLLNWNPVVHAMELIRGAWLPDFQPMSVSWEYLAASAVIAMCIAMILYRRHWTRMIAS